MLLGISKRLRLLGKSPVPLDPGSSIIDLQCKAWVADLGLAVRQRRYENLRKLCYDGKTLRCSSIGSGSGMGELSVHYGMKRLCHSLLDDKDKPQIDSNVKFVCECDAEKAAWLRKLKVIHEDTRHFIKAEELSSERALCRQSGTSEVVGDVDLLHAGVSCKDLSGLNDEAGQNLTLILAWLKNLSPSNEFQCKDEDIPEGSTATTLLATLRYINRHRPAMIMVENVMAFAELEVELKRLLREMGYASVIIAVNSLDFGVPQSRPRIYLVAVNRLARPGMPLTAHPSFDAWETEWSNHLRTALNSMKATERRPLDDYLLPIDSHLLKAILEEIPMPIDPDESVLKWPAKHDDLFKSIDLPRRPSLRQLSSFRAAMHGDINRAMWDRICRRQKEIVFFFTALWVKTDQTFEWAIDTSQNLWRLGKQGTQDYVPCLTGSSRIWLVKSQRLLLGRECLALQGINEGDIECLGNFSNTLHWSLAGNAFTGVVAAAVFNAALD